MNRSNKNKGVYLHRQIVSNTEEIIPLKTCFVNLGIRVNNNNNKCNENKQSIDSELTCDLSNDYMDSDTTEVYLNDSSTESYDSEDNGLTELKQQLLNKEVTTKQKTSSLINNNKMRSKPKEVICSQMLFEEKTSHSDEAKLSYYLCNKTFESQSLSSSQKSLLIQQNGKFTYFASYSIDNHLNETTIKLKQNIEYLLKPLTCEESNSWPLVLKIINEDLFAFRKPSEYSIELVQKVLSHYDWSDLKENISSNDIMYFKQLHNKFITNFMRQIALSSYSRDHILTIISGSTLESNAWTFVSHLISFIIVKTGKEKDESNFAFIHLSLIIDLLTRDFEKFLRESNDYCIDISRIERKENFKPLVVRLIWSTKDPNYINSVLKHLVYLIIKAIKVKNDLLLIELFKLFELCAECLRIGSGNVRPFASFGHNRPTLVNELFQQLSSESFVDYEVIEKLLSLTSTLSWAKLQLCAHILSQMVDFQARFSFKKQMSLEMIICYFMTGDVNRFEHKLTQKANTESPFQPKQSTPQLESPRKRSSLGLITRSPAVSSRKSWSKKNLFGENRLHIACKKGNGEQLRELLQSSIDGFGCDPNETDNSGYSPLCEAAFHGHVSCIKELIDWEKCSNRKLDYELGPKPERQTALHDAIENNYVECAQLIIENGGTHLLEKKRSDGKTPKDLIKSAKMRRMIEVKEESERKFEPSIKVNIKSDDEANIFVSSLAQMITSYIETTKIDHFIGLHQNQWTDKFSYLFSRDLNQADIDCIEEDLKAVNKLPNILKDLKQSFKLNSHINDLIDQFEIAIDSLLS